MSNDATFILVKFFWKKNYVQEEICKKIVGGNLSLQSKLLKTTKFSYVHSHEKRKETVLERFPCNLLLFVPK